MKTALLLSCPEIPTWFIALATWGAVSGAGLIAIGLIAWVASLFVRKDEEPVTHIGQIDGNRRIFR